MADLPRYQLAGVQYADLPRLSTAPQQALAQGLSQLGNQLDRMTAFFEDQATTEAKKEALKYAVENPLTKEQVDTALKNPEGLKVKGAGRVFQQTYEQAQATMLSNELQLEGQRKLSSVAAMIDAGAAVDLKQIQTDLKDMIDGYSATVMALNPEQSIKLRAALATSGNALYTKAAERAVKIQQEQYDAKLNQAVEQSRPLVESLIAKAGTIDPTTGQAVDIEKMLEIQRQPFMEAIKLTGNSKHIDAFNKVITNAKIGALEAKLIDREFAPDAGTAMQKLLKGDFGNLSAIYKGLDQGGKDSVREKVLKSFSDVESARKIDEAKTKADNKIKGNALTIEFLNPKTSIKRQQEIVKDLINLDELTITQGAELLKPKDPVANPILNAQLYDGIKRGTITKISDLVQYSGSLSKAEFTALSHAVTDSQGRMAIEEIKREAGIRENSFISEDQKKKEKRLLDFYTTVMGETEKNAQGIEVPIAPVRAAKKAIDLYNNDKTIAQQNTAREDAANAIRKAMEAKNLQMPGVPVEQIDFDKVKGLDDGTRRRLKDQQKKYKDNL